MPSFFIPARSSRHRTACIALYRALLQQCARIALPDDVLRGPINPIKHHVRRAFQRNKHDTSPRLIVTALKVGYEIETLLRTAAHGDQPSHSKILALLRDIQARSVKSTPPPPSPSPSPTPAPTPTPTPKPKPKHIIPAPHPSAPLLLTTRPLPKNLLSGRRHVPVLVNANGVPYLRIKKPQSAYLSRVIRDKIATKQRRTDRMEELATWAEWGAEEESWERHLRAETGYGGGSGNGDGIGQQQQQQQQQQRQQQQQHRARSVTSRSPKPDADLGPGRGRDRGRGRGRDTGDDGGAASSDAADPGDGRWDDEAKRARQLVFGQIDAQNRRNAGQARKMLGIVDRETELARAERRARKREGERARKRRRRRRKGEGERAEGRAGSSGRGDGVDKPSFTIEA